MVYRSSLTAVGDGNREIAYTVVQPESTPGQTVCFICPGTGYSFDKPLLYYATMLILGKGIDVVQVEYLYKDDATFWTLSEEAQSERMQTDVGSVVSRVLAERGYRDVMFVGKSIGTMPIVNGFCLDPRFAESTMVLLTPVLSRANLAGNLLRSTQRMLIAMGKEDPFYDARTIGTIQSSKPNVEVLLVDGANHALDVGWNVPGSIDVLKTVMARMERFVESNVKKD